MRIDKSRDKFCLTIGSNFIILIYAGIFRQKKTHLKRGSMLKLDNFSCCPLLYNPKQEPIGQRIRALSLNSGYATIVQWTVG